MIKSEKFRYFSIKSYSVVDVGPPGVFGVWGEGLFIFRELGSTANYFKGSGEQAYTFGDLESTAKMLKK